MKKNIGIIDSIIQVVLATTIAFLYIITEIVGTKGAIAMLFQHYY